jgi:sodium transport system permease protein
MNRVLKGEPVGLLDMALPLAVCTLITAAGVVFVARQLRSAALR